MMSLYSQQNFSSRLIFSYSFFFSLLQVCDTRWSLSVLNGPQYELCSTYPQLMYIPKGIDVSLVINRVSLHVQCTALKELGKDLCVCTHFCICLIKFDGTIDVLVSIPLQDQTVVECSKFRSKVSDSAHH